MLVLTQKQRRRNEQTYEEIHITHLPTKEVMVISTEKAFDGKARLGFAGSKELFEVKRVTVTKGEPCQQHE